MQLRWWKSRDKAYVCLESGRVPTEALQLVLDQFAPEARPWVSDPPGRVAVRNVVYGVMGPQDLQRLSDGVRSLGGEVVGA